AGAAASAGTASAWPVSPALAGAVSCAQPAAARARIIAAASFPLCSIGTTPLWKAGNPAITAHGRQGLADELHGAGCPGQCRPPNHKAPDPDHRARRLACKAPGLALRARSLVRKAPLPCAQGNEACNGKARSLARKPRSPERKAFCFKHKARNLARKAGELRAQDFELRKSK